MSLEAKIARKLTTSVWSRVKKVEKSSGFRCPAGRNFFQLVGCVPADYQAHIQVQFREGMSWQTWGRWHLDHKRPVASFKFDGNLETWRACFGYQNVQVLWAEENLGKGSLYKGVRDHRASRWNKFVKACSSKCLLL